MARLGTLILLVALSCATAVSASDNSDAAHHADRLRTERLNRSAAAAVARRDAANARSLNAGQDAQEAYQRRLAAWQRQVAACWNGDYAACDPR